MIQIKMVIKLRTALKNKLLARDIAFRIIKNKLSKINQLVLESLIPLKIIDATEQLLL